MSEKVFNLYIDLVCSAITKGFCVEWHDNVIKIYAPEEGKPE